jgi:hypothetical protein
MTELRGVVYRVDSSCRPSIIKAFINECFLLG